MVSQLDLQTSHIVDKLLTSATPDLPSHLVSRLSAFHVSQMADGKDCRLVWVSFQTYHINST